MAGFEDPKGLFQPLILKSGRDWDPRDPTWISSQNWRDFEHSCGFWDLKGPDGAFPLSSLQRNQNSEGNPYVWGLGQDREYELIN